METFWILLVSHNKMNRGVYLCYLTALNTALDMIVVFVLFLFSVTKTTKV